MDGEIKLFQWQRTCLSVGNGYLAIDDLKSTAQIVDNLTKMSTEDAHIRIIIVARED